jgi:hypothetical protein
MSEFLARALRGPGPVVPNALLAALRKSMGHAAGDPRTVALLAAQAVGSFDLWIKAFSRDPIIDPRRIRAIANALVLAGRDSDLDRDGAVQLYLALEALAQALSDQGNPLDSDAHRAIQDLSGPLSFPNGYDSPRGAEALVPGPFGQALGRIRF